MQIRPIGLGLQVLRLRIYIYSAGLAFRFLILEAWLSRRPYKRFYVLVLPSQTQGKWS